ncbi:MAG TPA: vitamin K epoxide reductase family protein [Candidatus Methylomirabilis sp.]|nr:vitamin K epoxide reductase family protein [Candidatus Methylomirabilis sp.]
MKDDEGRASQAWLWAPVILSTLGVLVSGYLSVKRVTGGSLACSRWADCDVVNTSVYAKIYGVPVAFIGLAGYLVLMGLAMAALQAEGAAQRRLLTLGFLLSLGGFGFSVYLTYLEIYVIEAICMWCVISALLISLLAIVGGFNLRRTAYEPLDTSPTPSTLRP